MCYALNVDCDLTILNGSSQRSNTLYTYVLTWYTLTATPNGVKQFLNSHFDESLIYATSENSYPIVYSNSSTEVRSKISSFQTSCTDISHVMHLLDFSINCVQTALKRLLQSIFFSWLLKNGKVKKLILVTEFVKSALL